VLVLRDWQDTERDGQVTPGCGGEDTRHGQRLRDVHAHESRVRELRAKNLAVEHPRQKEIVCEFRLSRNLRRRVYLGIRTPHHPGFRATRHWTETRGRPPCRRGGRLRRADPPHVAGSSPAPTARQAPTRTRGRPPCRRGGPCGRPPPVVIGRPLSRAGSSPAPTAR